MAIKKISEFVSATPTSEDKILFEHNGAGKSATISDVGKAMGLSTVATSGSYNDLSNKPTIPNVKNEIYLGDLNQATTSGFYRIKYDQANAPAPWGQLLVVHGGEDTVAQLYFQHGDGSVYSRAGNPPEVGGSGVWLGWRRLWKEGDAVTGAVWNDLIDCIDIPEDDILEPGYCYCMHEDGHYRKSEKYLDSRYIGIDSDTYSLAMGMEKDKRKLNAAVAGFVLAYVDKEYPAGTALTCTENGYLTEIKKEDKCYNPEMIIAKYWKNEEREEIVREDKTVRVNGRKWVKVV